MLCTWWHVTSCCLCRGARGYGYGRHYVLPNIKGSCNCRLCAINGVRFWGTNIVVNGAYTGSLIALLAACGVAGWLAQKAKIPTGYMLGPVFLLMGIHIAGIDVPKLPLSLLHIAQLMLGIYIGLLLKKKIYIYRRSMCFTHLYRRVSLLAQLMA